MCGRHRLDAVTGEVGARTYVDSVSFYNISKTAPIFIMRVKDPRSPEKHSTVSSNSLNCNGFCDLPDGTPSFNAPHFRPLITRSQASLSDHHVSLPVCPFPPTS